MTPRLRGKVWKDRGAAPPAYQWAWAIIPVGSELHPAGSRFMWWADDELESGRSASQADALETLGALFEAADR